MLAFAGNSILCRFALRDAAIDPASFTAIRLASGAMTLLLIVWLARRGAARRPGGSWQSALLLFVYAISFSYAYITLSAGAGALILFGFVQGTMIATGLWRGDRPGTFEWIGWFLALIGLVWFVLPGVAAPPVTGAGLMALAGIAWGLYSIRGKGESDALASTTSNFVMSLAFVVLLTGLAYSEISITSHGFLLAVASGAITSGVGYVVWYAALDYLSAMRAALVQLSVPVIATIGGMFFLSEPLSLRLITASALVLGGITLALRRKSARA